MPALTVPRAQADLCTGSAQACPRPDGLLNQGVAIFGAVRWWSSKPRPPTAPGTFAAPTGLQPPPRLCPFGAVGASVNRSSIALLAQCTAAIACCRLSTREKGFLDRSATGGQTGPSSGTIVQRSLHLRAWLSFKACRRSEAPRQWLARHPARGLPMGQTLPTFLLP